MPHQRHDLRFGPVGMTRVMFLMRLVDPLRRI